MLKAGNMFIPENDPYFKRVFEASGDKFDCSHLEAALKYVTDFSVAIDGGAHVGSWARVMAKHFQRVIAFEPEPTNFKCLMKNIRGLGNIVLLERGLSNKFDLVRMAKGSENSGQAHVSEHGEFAQVGPIDEMMLDSLGLLKLDVEGYELFALEGAEKTIRRFKPLIVVEQNGLSNRYGYTDIDLANYLKTLGYKELERHNKDVIYGFDSSTNIAG